MTTEATPLLSLRGISKQFKQSQNWFDAVLRRPVSTLKAVDQVNLDIQRRQVLGLVGESGSGKSTIARCIVHLYPPDHGQILYDGINITSLSAEALMPYRKKIQMIFQDPYSSLNPRMTVGETIAEVVDFHRIVPPAERSERVSALLNQVGLSQDLMARRPIQLSGGQRQRVGIARALAVNPELLVADEPVSALDVSIQAQIINLLHQLQHELQLTMIFISHDLRVVRHISNQVAVIYLGRIVEESPTDELFSAPLHPYSKALMAAAPRIQTGYQRRSLALPGEIPSSYHIPTGCRFHTRCPIAQANCTQVVPEMREVSPSHWVACHHANPH